MPLSSNTDSPRHGAEAGTLYVVATPIGNLDDITVRALAVLKAVDIVAAEDTRKTGQLLRRHGINRPRVSYYEHNESERTPELVHRLLAGSSIALVTNAGTPAISDPGYRLVSEAAASGIRIVPLPGPSAAAAALSAAALPTDAFVFVGFLPRKASRRQREISALAAEKRTLILYESPRRVTGLLEELLRVMGDRRAVLAREMTKIHEEFIRGRLSDLLQRLKDRPDVKGECTLLVAGGEAPEPSGWDEVQAEIRSELAAGRRGLSGLAKAVAARHGLPRQAVYAEAVRIKAQQ
jgi:16S rRNA (cytidine1402-2'-O)-methyltransferase